MRIAIPSGLAKYRRRPLKGCPDRFERFVSFSRRYRNACSLWWWTEWIFVPTPAGRSRPKLLKVSPHNFPVKGAVLTKPEDPKEDPLDMPKTVRLFFTIHCSS